MARRARRQGRTEVDGGKTAGDGPLTAVCQRAVAYDSAPCNYSHEHAREIGHVSVKHADVAPGEAPRRRIWARPWSARRSGGPELGARQAGVAAQPPGSGRKESVPTSEVVGAGAAVVVEEGDRRAAVPDDRLH